MRILIVAACILGTALLAIVGFGLFQYDRLFPSPSTEVVQLTPQARDHLQRLRAERKFQPHDYPPLGYTGAETPAHEATATAAVNAVIDAVLAMAAGPIPARKIEGFLKEALDKVDMLATEDRERTQDYLIEIWYIIGFKGATGLFAHGAAFPKPDGRGEPLPLGWTAADKPRPIP
ncbi:DUF4844 domain-containing protein [Bradyrhizobium sp. HKCCYLS2038]|uniref:DUF4844 domain-containing protein n=1 Tax=unclassified Bradyrhizobium TaxID=2631580 RepID=UPI003EBF98C4